MGLAQQHAILTKINVDRNSEEVEALIGRVHNLTHRVGALFEEQAEARFGVQAETELKTSAENALKELNAT